MAALAMATAVLVRVLGKNRANYERVEETLKTVTSTSSRTRLEQDMSRVVAARRASNLARRLRCDDATESDDEFVSEEENEKEEQESSINRVDLCSNDYLGLARSSSLAREIAETIEARAAKRLRVLGSTGSRLLTGDSVYARSFEKELARLHGASEALLFNSGYDANLALLSVLPTEETLVVYDELIHASMHAGVNASRCKRRKSFMHNNVADLERILDAERRESSSSPILVAIESVYSMDGHVAKRDETLAACKKYGAALVIDEAHGLGTFGINGLGVFTSNNKDDDDVIIARVYTFGKALGAHGACVVGSVALRDYLINYGKPLIYSTSLPIHSVIHARLAYKEMARIARAAQEKLKRLSRRFLSAARDKGIVVVGETALDEQAGASPIWGVLVPGNERCVNVATWLRSKGFYILPVRSPTVPKGAERLRVILHAYNAAHQVDAFVEEIDVALKKYPS